MRKGLVISGSIAVLITVLAILYYSRTQVTSSSPETVPALQGMLDQFTAKGRDYTDPDYCVECHEEVTTQWESSHHALANAPLRDVDRDRLLHRPTELLGQRRMNWIRGKNTVRLEEKGLPDYPVIGSIGITPLIQYLHMAPDGRIQTHDVAWDVEKEEWFSVFERDDIEPRIPGEWGHWTGQGMNWDANCAYCHMTEYRKNFDPETNTYNREWAHMAITCAQCHPKMEVHLSQIRNGNNEFKETLDPVQVMEYCATCHARREQLSADSFVAGDRFEDHFSLTLADIPGVYHPDGQVIGENYVYGSLTMSKMGHKGITCMDCHDPHTTGHILPFENNALCQRCHGSGLQDAPKIDPLAHSRHKADSTGNRCVECHMPVSYFMGRDGRRDHSFSHPDPKLTLDLDIPNACTGCHNTQSVEWALEYTEKWYGKDMNADRREKAYLMADLWNGKPDTGPRLREAIRKEENRYWKSTFLSMMRYAPPDPENYNVVSENLTHADPLVRASAVRTIGLDSLGEETKTALLNDPLRIVRLYATLSSSSLETATGEFDREFDAYARHTADTPVGALRYGAYWLSRGDIEQAEHNIRQATSFEPVNPGVWRLAAIQLYQLGKPQAAAEYFRKALDLSPENPEVLFNMGLMAYEQNDVETALAYLNRAVRADPMYEDAWYNLIALYWSLQQMPTARARLQEALANNPDSPRLQQLMVSLQSQE